MKEKQETDAPQGSGKQLDTWEPSFASHLSRRGMAFHLDWLAGYSATVNSLVWELPAYLRCWLALSDMQAEDWGTKMEFKNQSGEN